MKVTFYCDICHIYLFTREIEEATFDQLSSSSLTDNNMKDIINYTDKAGLHLYSLCQECIGKL